MPKNPVSFLLFLLFFTSCRKDLLQWQSVQQIKVGTNEQLNTALFLPNGIGMIGAGSRFGSAKLFISADQGLSWQAKQMPDGSKGLFGSCVAPDGNVFFCGFGLNICASKDALNSFTLTRISGPYEFASAISFGDKDRGLASTSLGTDSGGIVQLDASMNLLSFQRFKFALHDVHMLNPNKGIAVGSGAILLSNDGGISWQQQSVVGDNFNSISALDSNHIFVSGLSGFVVKTSDGGKTWKRLRNGSNLSLPNYQLWDLLFVSAQKGYAVGEKGLVIYTDDGGEHWMEFAPFTRNNLRFISLCPDGKLLVGGENGCLFRLEPK
jgi:photosystem II stability/assembly factor-like uncharacterized protein